MIDADGYSSIQAGREMRRARLERYAEALAEHTAEVLSDTAAREVNLEKLFEDYQENRDQSRGR